MISSASHLVMNFFRFYLSKPYLLSQFWWEYLFSEAFPAACFSASLTLDLSLYFLMSWTVPAEDLACFLLRFPCVQYITFSFLFPNSLCFCISSCWLLSVSLNLIFCPTCGEVFHPHVLRFPYRPKSWMLVSLLLSNKPFYFLALSSNSVVTTMQTLFVLVAPRKPWKSSSLLLIYFSSLTE